MPSWAWYLIVLRVLVLFLAFWKLWELVRQVSGRLEFPSGSGATSEPTPEPMPMEQRQLIGLPVPTKANTALFGFHVSASEFPGLNDREVALQLSKLNDLEILADEHTDYVYVFVATDWSKDSMSSSGRIHLSHDCSNMLNPIRHRCRMQNLLGFGLAHVCCKCTKVANLFPPLADKRHSKYIGVGRKDLRSVLSEETIVAGTVDHLTPMNFNVPLRRPWNLQQAKAVWVFTAFPILTGQHARFNKSPCDNRLHLDKDCCRQCVSLVYPDDAVDSSFFFQYACDPEILCGVGVDRWCGNCTSVDNLAPDRNETRDLNPESIRYAKLGRKDLMSESFVANRPGHGHMLRLRRQLVDGCRVTPFVKGLRRRYAVSKYCPSITELINDYLCVPSEET